MRAIIFGDFFEPTDELNEFVKSLGYGCFNYKNFDIMFDPRVVDFCEQRLSPLWNEMVYKGKESDKFRCGFAGAGYIRDIDIGRKWNIRYNNVDSPQIKYIDVRSNDYGYTTFVSVV